MISHVHVHNYLVIVKSLKQSKFEQKYEWKYRACKHIAVLSEMNWNFESAMKRTEALTNNASQVRSSVVLLKHEIAGILCGKKHYY